jgi:hypothetical protein
MTTTTNPESQLRQLRSLMPTRSLLKHEAMRIAELQANRLLEAAGVDQPGTPTDIVAGLPFLQVIHRSELPVSGSAQWIKPRWIVLINSSEPMVRQRFSLMHEFKHILDHQTADYRTFGPDETEVGYRSELIADYFAACVLMPRRLVKRLWGEGVQHPRHLAAAFGVSDLAMRYRLQQLGLTERFARRHGRHQPSPPRIYWRERSAHLLPLAGVAA